MDLDEFERVALADWPAVVDACRRFAGEGRVDVDADRVTLSVGASSVVVTRDGRVETGMPLHAFAVDDAAALWFDHDGGRLAVDDDGVTYEFRRP